MLMNNSSYVVVSLAIIILVFPWFSLAVVVIFGVFCLPYKFCKAGMQLTKRYLNGVKNICIYVYIYLYVYMCMCMCMCVCTRVGVCMLVRVCVQVL